MLHAIPDDMVLAAVKHTHVQMVTIPGGKLKTWLQNQVKDFRTKAFEWVTPRVKKLVVDHGGVRKWEKAGY